MECAVRLAQRDDAEHAAASGDEALLAHVVRADIDDADLSACASLRHRVAQRAANVDVVVADAERTVWQRHRSAQSRSRRDRRRSNRVHHCDWRCVVLLYLFHRMFVVHQTH